jgi:hypothetical protein
VIEHERAEGCGWMSLPPIGEIRLLDFVDDDPGDDGTSEYHAPRPRHPPEPWLIFGD